MSERRETFRATLPGIVNMLDKGKGAILSDIYAEIAARFPQFIDDEPDPYQPTGEKWKHDLRWELETLVLNGSIRRRKDLGRGRYSVDWAYVETGPGLS